MALPVGRMKPCTEEDRLFAWVRHDFNDTAGDGCPTSHNRQNCDHPLSFSAHFNGTTVPFKWAKRGRLGARQLVAKRLRTLVGCGCGDRRWRPFRGRPFQWYGRTTKMGDRGGGRAVRLGVAGQLGGIRQGGRPGSFGSRAAHVARFAPSASHSALVAEPFDTCSRGAKR